MLFGSLFKGEKGIMVGRRRKRKLTARDVIDRLNRFELTTANCTLIRDPQGNERIESYGQVDVFRVRDEEVLMLDNTFCITTPTGMKLKGDGGGADLSSIVSEVSGSAHDPFEDEEDEEDEESVDEDLEEGEDEELQPIDAAPPPKNRKRIDGQIVSDAYSGDGPQHRASPTDQSDNVLGVGQVIRLRFFFRRIPYEIDCQIVERFNPSQLDGDLDLTPRLAVGFRVKPLTDVRNRDQRRYIRYTHRMGFGHLRLRNEIQFHVFAHRTTLEIPEQGVLAPILSIDDFTTTAYGTQEVAELKDADRLEDIVEFYMHCMVNNPTERRHVYISKPYFDQNRRRSSLEGLGYYNSVGAQQKTILPKIFLKKQQGKTVLERMLAEKGKGPRDTHKMRIIEDIEDRYSLLTRERKIWKARRRQKTRMENYDNDICHAGFLSPYGVAPSDLRTIRPLTMNCELIDIGVENLTLKPLPYDDAQSRESEAREYVRQEDGFQVDLLNFSVGGALIRGGEDESHDDAFFRYLVGEEFEQMRFEDRVEALRKNALLLYFYPVLTFTRSQIQDFEPNLPFRIPVLARVARFRTLRNSEKEEPRIVSLGVEFIYNPISDAFSRDLNLYDQWEQITPYTENQHFISVHKSLQLLFGFDRALDEDLREDIHKKDAGGETPPAQTATEKNPPSSNDS